MDEGNTQKKTSCHKLHLHPVMIRNGSDRTHVKLMGSRGKPLRHWVGPQRWHQKPSMHHMPSQKYRGLG